MLPDSNTYVSHWREHNLSYFIQSSFELEFVLPQGSKKQRALFGCVELYPILFYTQWGQPVLGISITKFFSDYYYDAVTRESQRHTALQRILRDLSQNKRHNSPLYDDALLNNMLLVVNVEDTEASDFLRQALLAQKYPVGLCQELIGQWTTSGILDKISEVLTLSSYQYMRGWNLGGNLGRLPKLPLLPVTTQDVVMLLRGIYVSPNRLRLSGNSRRMELIGWE